MPNRLPDAALKQLYLDARTFRAWQARDVPDTVLREIVDLMEMGPPAKKGRLARVLFIKSNGAKERLRPHLSEGNVDKTMSAPVTAIVGHDLRFFAHRPAGDQALKGFDDKPDQARTVAF